MPNIGIWVNDDDKNNISLIREIKSELIRSSTQHEFREFVDNILEITEKGENKNKLSGEITYYDWTQATDAVKSRYLRDKCKSEWNREGASTLIVGWINDLLEGKELLDSARTIVASQRNHELCKSLRSSSKARSSSKSKSSKAKSSKSKSSKSKSSNSKSSKAKSSKAKSKVTDVHELDGGYLIKMRKKSRKNKSHRNKTRRIKRR